MDMDFIRRALGVPTISYLGFSYGTFLGATYAKLYPTHVRAMVLDGALDPQLTVLKSLDYQSAAFEADLNAMFASCKKSPTCPWKPGADPLGAFETLMAAVTSRPIAVPGSPQSFGLAQLLYATGAGLYSQSTWPTLESGLAQLEKGNPSILHGLFDSYIGLSAGRLGNELEAETAVNCLDAPAPSLPALEAAAPAAQAAAPVFGLMNLYSELVCSLWPVPATAKPAPIAADGAPPIVVVGTTGDPATPYSEAVALASQLRSGVLVTRVGEGHTAYPYSSCVRSYVNSYLIALKVPPSGVRCPSN
jgi:pimeloyl-ACP methyl ester carboxylesterase